MLPAAHMISPHAWDRWRLGLAFGSGLMLGVSFAPLDLAGLAWIAPGLILLLGRGQTATRVFRIGWFAGLGHQLVALHWLLQIPMPLNAVLVWLGLSAYLALFPATWCWVCWRGLPRLFRSASQGVEDRFARLSGGQRAAWALLCGVAWVAMEMGVARLLTGFPWNLLGASQYRFLPLIQIAAVTGVYGVSFLVAWMSVALACVVVGMRLPGRRWLALRELAGPGAVCLGVCVWGGSRLTPPEAGNPSLKVALIQPSIPQPVLWDPNETTNRLDTLLALSRTALAERPDLLVWPEAALPQVLARSRVTQEIVTGLLRDRGAWLVFGGEDTGRKTGATGEAEVHRFNTAFLINPAGELTARYHKRQLVVFGEYMPAVRVLPFLRYLRETGGGLTPGRQPGAFRLDAPRAVMSPSICFEDVFPHLTREAVDEETDLLLNLTNNGWFGAGAAQWQHAANAVFRAVENGVPLVRCANNGLTCWIDPRGRLHGVYFDGSRDIYQAGIKLADIPLRPASSRTARTCYNRHGDWFAWSCVGLTGLACVVPGLFRRGR
jgi:apolipoprotein N-acyltransferase